MAKINKLKSWFFEKMKLTNFQPDSSKKKKTEKNQTNKIKNEKEEVTTVNAEIQRSIRDYYGQLYGNKMDNLEEMDKFLEKFNLPKLSQEEIEIMSNPITISEIEAVIKNLPQKTKPKTRCLHRRILSNIQRRANTYPSRTLSKNFRGRNTSKLILRDHHHPDTKTTQRQQKKSKLQDNITDEHRCKNPQQNFSKQNSARHQKSHMP